MKFKITNTAYYFEEDFTKEIEVNKIEELVEILRNSESNELVVSLIREDEDGMPFIEIINDYRC